MQIVKDYIAQNNWQKEGEISDIGKVVLSAVRKLSITSILVDGVDVTAIQSRLPASIPVSEWKPGKTADLLIKRDSAPVSGVKYIVGTNANEDPILGKITLKENKMSVEKPVEKVAEIEKKGLAIQMAIEGLIQGSLESAQKQINSLQEEKKSFVEKIAQLESRVAGQDKRISKIVSSMQALSEGLSEKE